MSVWQNGEISKQNCNVRSKVFFYFDPKKDHDSGLKKRDTLEKNLYYEIVGRARKFDVKRYCSQKRYIATICMIDMADTSRIFEFCSATKNM